MPVCSTAGQRPWQLKVRRTENLKYPIYDGTVWAKHSVLHLIDGGEIAFNEALELLVEARRYRNRQWVSASALELRLYLGHCKDKLKKLKGFKAATQVAHLLAEYPQLKPTNLTVRFQVERDLATFDDAKTFADRVRILHLITDPHAVIEPRLKASFSAEDKSTRQLAFEKAVGQTVTAMVHQLDDGLARLETRNHEIQTMLKINLHPIHGSEDAATGAAVTARANEVVKTELERLRTDIRSKTDQCQTYLTE